MSDSECGDSELRELARAYRPACVESLARMAGVDDGPPATAEPVRLAATIALLDRGYGRPPQMLSGDRAQPLIVDFRWADQPAPAEPAGALPPLIEAAAEPVDAEGDDDELEVVWQTGEAAA